MTVGMMLGVAQKPCDGPNAGKFVDMRQHSLDDKASWHFSLGDKSAKLKKDENTLK